jgi:hypothetical protein
MRKLKLTLARSIQEYGTVEIEFSDHRDLLRKINAELDNVVFEAEEATASDYRVTSCQDSETGEVYDGFDLEEG